MNTEQKAKMQKMVNAFQRDQGQDKKAQNQYSLDDLEELDTYIGNRDINKSYRLAIQKRIANLKKQEEKKEDRKYGSRIRALDTVLKLAIGIIVGWVLAKVL